MRNEEKRREREGVSRKEGEMRKKIGRKEAWRERSGRGGKTGINGLRKLGKKKQRQKKG